MNARLRRRIVNLATGLVALAALAVLVGGFALPVRVPRPAGASTGDSPADATAPATRPGRQEDRGGAPSLADLKRLAAIDLRRPLFDEPTAGEASEQAPAPPAPLPVSLIGIADEPGHSMAIFQTSKGGIKVCAEGQSVEADGVTVKVLEIDRGTVTVLHAGAPRELSLPPQP